jgi:hypothetical protein
VQEERKVIRWAAQLQRNSAEERLAFLSVSPSRITAGMRDITSPNADMSKGFVPPFRLRRRPPFGGESEVERPHLRRLEEVRRLRREPVLSHPSPKSTRAIAKGVTMRRKTTATDAARKDSRLPISPAPILGPAIDLRPQNTLPHFVPTTLDRSRGSKPLGGPLERVTNEWPTPQRDSAEPRP